MYRIFATHGVFVRNVSLASIRNRMERSTQQCAFCKNRHSCNTKRIQSISKRYSASAASLGGIKRKEKDPKSSKYHENINVLLDELKDADMSYIETTTSYIGDTLDGILPSDDELFGSFSTSTSLDESEFSTSVTFAKLKKDVPINETNTSNLKVSATNPHFLTKMEYKFNRTNWYSCLMDAYTKTGNADLAIKLLEVARAYKIVKPGSKAQTIYNLLIDFSVRESNHQSAITIYKYMLQDHIKPDIQTFISLIKMARELSNSKCKAFLLNLEAQMAAANLQFNDLFERGTFQYDDKEVVLANVRMVYPEFSPTYNFIPEGESDRDKSAISYVTDTRTSYKEYLENRMDFRQMQIALKEQIRNEWEGFVEVDNISLSKEDAVYRQMEREQHAEIEKKWRAQLLASFDRRVSELEQLEKRNGSVEVLYPYLLLMDKDMYVDCMLKELIMLCKVNHSFAKPLSAVAQDLGQSIYKKYVVQSLIEMGVLDKMVDIHYRYLQWYSGLRDLGTTNSRNAWKRIQYEADKEGASSTAMIPKWPNELSSTIGGFLANLLIEDVTIPSLNPSRSLLPAELPVLNIVYSRLEHTMVRQVQCNTQITRVFKERGCTKLTFHTSELPSKCPPRPWCSPLEGGYYISNNCVLRRARQMNCLQTNLLEAQPPAALLPIYDSLNVLGAIPWKVNEPILDLIQKIFMNGGSEELDVPPPGSSIEDLTPVKFVSDLEERQFSKKQYMQKMKRQAVHSLWCDTLHRLSIANYYRGALFWLPHSIDFRGRAYPIPPHLSHMCSDLSRSLLLFGFGRPLGPNGLDWLKIHVINLSGRMKQKSVKDKLDYANKCLDEIIDSAERPMTGNRWWAVSDTRWQVLASCMEIANALKHKNPEEYISYLPIHQDGSCNGLQHYAALGRDEFGAVSVNLRKSEKPQDVYSVVVEQVEKMRKKDAEKGIEIAKSLEGFISRKMIKQTIMTTVYGVTMFGARQQIERQLKGLEKFPNGLYYTASKYLAIKTFDALNEMFVSAKEIQEWLTNCARLITRSCHRPVEWITPMGLHVLQPYIKSEYTGRGVDQMKMILDKVKQKNAFAPNFIHSLDSTHMMLTSLQCEAADIAFASVHDCFWTHALTVSDMNRICREEFVKLHSEPIVENLHHFFMDYYNNKKSPCAEYSRQFETNKTVKFPEPPKKGQFNIKEVLDSPYFFS